MSDQLGMKSSFRIQRDCLGAPSPFRASYRALLLCGGRSAAPLPSNQFGQVMCDCQQMQFGRKTGESPQTEAPNPPIVLPAPKDRFNDSLPLFIDGFRAFCIELLPNYADLFMVRSQLKAAKSTRIVRALRPKGTFMTIRTSVDFRRSAPVMVHDKRQFLSLRASKLVFGLVVSKPIGVIGRHLTLAPLRVVQLSRRLRIRQPSRWYERRVSTTRSAECPRAR